MTTQEITNAEERTILIAENELTLTQNLPANISAELRTLLTAQSPQNLDTAMDIITNYEILTSQISESQTLQYRRTNSK